jgi:AraC-like DNA-binding protein
VAGTGDEITFLYGESVPRCNHRIDKRFVGYYTLQYMSAGAVALAIDDRAFRLEGKWFWSAWPGPRIRFHAAPTHKTWQHRYLAFRGPVVERWSADGLFPIEPQPATSRRDYASRFDLLLERALSADRFSRMRALHLIEEILIELAEARSGADRGRGPGWLSKVIEQFRAAGRNGDVDYAATAEQVGLSESAFRRRFRDATGVPPHEFVLQARVAEARRMLVESNVPIKVIAQRLNYRDVYFFSRQFRQMTGVPPALYRESRQG